MHVVPSALLSASRSGLIPEGASILLAVSGGADSLALLYAAAEVASEGRWRVSVAHVHHGWRGRDADRDLEFVRDHARRLRLPFFSRRRDARAFARTARLSPEAAARHVRYAALADMAREAGAERIVTAHQGDDRIESHLLARQRKGGVSALAGPRRRRADGVVRPLLDVSRAEILDYLRSRGLSYRRDSSNGELRLARNRLRRELARENEAGAAPARSALVAAIDAIEKEREELDGDFERIVTPRASTGAGSVAIDVADFMTCPIALQRYALDELATPLAAPGLAPFTGREREEVLRRLAQGGDFRFEARRRIRIERRGPLLTLRLARSTAPLAPSETSADGGFR